jgi:mono/diheme cytochrome c family protein
MCRLFFAEVPVPQRMPTTLLCLTLIAAAYSMCAQTADRSRLPIRPVDGPAIFQNYCAACHGIDGRGNGPVVGALKQKVPNLTRLSQANGGTFPEMHVKNMITFGTDSLIPAHGSKTMPIWGPIFHEIEYDRDLGHVRLENLTVYLKSIQQN